MKNIFLFTSLLLISCYGKTRNDKATQNQIIAKDSINEVLIKRENTKPPLIKKQGMRFLVADNIITYDFNKLPLSILSINDNLKYVVNQNLKNEILKRDFYYDLIYYNRVKETEKFKSFTIVGSYDYHTDVLLITISKKDNSLIDSELIAMVLGDAGETTEIHSTRVKNTFFRTTQEKELKDGVYVIKTTVKDSIRIENDGQITLLH